MMEKILTYKGTDKDKLVNGDFVEVKEETDE